MNNGAAAELSKQDARLKAQADRYLAESLKILRALEAERLSYRAKGVKRQCILSEVKEILYGKA